MSDERFQVKTGPVTPAQAIQYAYDLETAVGEIMNRRRRPGKMPIEPICKLIQFVRDQAEAALLVAGEDFQGNAPTRH